MELNPVRARLVKRPEEYRWSGARSHLTGESDALLTACPLLNGKDEWREYLNQGSEPNEAEEISRHVRTGRPLGDRKFLAYLEKQLLRPLLPRKRGPKGPHKHKRRKQ